MNRYTLAAYRFGRVLGFDPRGLVGTVKNLPTFVQDLRTFRKLAKSAEARLPFSFLDPCLGQKTEDSGTAKGHYFHQDLLVARRIFESRPVKHVDVGSRIDGFVAHVASYRAIEVFDIRPLAQTIPNVTFRKADLSSLPPEYVGYADSVSCLHALEHFGLGRYGDPIDPDGHIKGLEALRNLVKPGGTLYLSVPIGPERIHYNAHRVLSIAYLLQLFAGKFTVNAFSYVDDKGDLHEKVALDDETVSRNAGCDYGCGIFELRRP